jgi:hypothetical protein
VKAKLSCCGHLLTQPDGAHYHCFSCGGDYMLVVERAGRDTLHDAIAPVQNPHLLAAVRKLDTSAIGLAAATAALATYLEHHQ